MSENIVEHGPFLDRCAKQIGGRHCWHEEGHASTCCWCGRVKYSGPVQSPDLTPSLEETKRRVEEAIEEVRRNPPPPPVGWPQWPGYHPSWPRQWWEKFPPGTIF